MHKCAAKCCEDQTSSIDSVQRCVDRCAAPLTSAQKYVHKELEEFQGRLQRCVMVREVNFDQAQFLLSTMYLSYDQQCNDDVKVQMSANPSEDEIAKFTAQFERCAVKCVDKHVGLIPSMLKTIKSVLSKGPKGIPEAQVWASAAKLAGSSQQMKAFNFPISLK